MRKRFTTLPRAARCAAFWLIVLLAASLPAGDEAAKPPQRDLAAMLRDGLGRPVDIQPQAFLEGCEETAATEVVAGADGTLTIRRHFREVDSQNGCTVTERFRTGDGSVRWEVEVQGTGEPWSRPIVVAVRYPAGPRTHYWMAWERPGGADPMDAAPLARDGGITYSYGAPRWRHDRPIEVWNAWSPFFARPHQERFVSVPIATWIEPGETGLSLIASPEPMQLDLEIAIEKDGEARFQWFRHRIAKDAPPVKLALDLVAHEDQWRGGMRWMVNRYRDYFDPPVAAVGDWVGCGQYARAVTELDVDQLRRMDFTLNWNATFDWPYMGMFVPPVSAEETWTSWYKQPASLPGIEAYAAWMREHGFHVLQYFNVTEFGSKVAFPRPSTAERDIWRDADWRNANEFLAARLWAAVVRVPEQADLLSKQTFLGNWGKSRPGALFYTWDDAVVTDCGEPVYRDYLLDQARRMMEVAPSSSGICIDRLDWIRLYNPDGDDGMSWFDGAPARALVWSWRALMETLGPMIHERGKVIFANGHYKRLDLFRQADCIYDEFGDNASLEGDNWLALRKPVVAFYGLIKSDAEFQKFLHWGIYPQVPCPGNDHGCPYGTPADRKIYEDYGPLLKLMRGRKWVLAPHCVAAVESPVKVNLFEVADGWVLPVTMGLPATTAKVAVRNVAGITAQARMEAFFPGDSRPRPVTATARDDGALELTVPLERGCAMVKIVKLAPQGGGSAADGGA